MAKRIFAWPIRVYYEDTDAAGIVYHANYLRFMERARAEWLRDLGFEQDALAREQGIVFVVTRSELRFKRPARFNEELVVESEIERLKRASLTFEQRITNRAGSAICTAHNTVACLDAERMSPRRLPPEMLRIFEREQ